MKKELCDHIKDLLQREVSGALELMNRAIDDNDKLRIDERVTGYKKARKAQSDFDSYVEDTKLED